MIRKLDELTERLDKVNAEKEEPNSLELYSWLEKDGAFDDNQNDFCRLVAAASGNQSTNSMGYYTATLLGSRILSALRVRLLNEDKNSVQPLGLMMGLIATSGSGKDYTIRIADDIFNEVILEPLYKNIKKRKIDLLQRFTDEKGQPNLAEAETLFSMAESSKSVKRKLVDIAAYKWRVSPILTTDKITEAGIRAAVTLNSELNKGALHIHLAEIGSALKSDSEQTRISIKLASELIDNGVLQARMTSTIAHATIGVENEPMTLLYSGPHASLVNDEEVSKIFTDELESKLARRSILYYSDESIYHDSNAEMDKIYRESKEEAVRMLKEIESGLSSIDDTRIRIDPMAQELLSKFGKWASLAEEFADSELMQRNAYGVRNIIPRVAAIYAVLDHDLVVKHKHALQACSFMMTSMNNMQEFIHKIKASDGRKLINLLESKSRVAQINDLRENNLFTSEAQLDMAISEAASMIDGTIEQIYNSENEMRAVTLDGKVLDSVKIDFTFLDIGLLTPNELYRKLKEEKVDKKVKQEVGQWVSYQAHQTQSTSLKSFAQMLKSPGVIYMLGREGANRKDSKIAEKANAILIDYDGEMKNGSDPISLNELSSRLKPMNHMIMRTSDNGNDKRGVIILPMERYMDMNPEIYNAVIEEIEDITEIKIDKDGAVKRFQICYANGIAINYLGGHYYTGFKALKKAGLFMTRAEKESIDIAEKKLKTLEKMKAGGSKNSSGAKEAMNDPIASAVKLMNPSSHDKIIEEIAGMSKSRSEREKQGHHLEQAISRLVGSVFAEELWSQKEKVDKLKELLNQFADYDRIEELTREKIIVAIKKEDQ